MPQQVTLIPIDRACAELVAQSPEAFAERHSVGIVGVGEHMTSVIAMTPPLMLDAGSWGTYFACDPAGRSVIGGCGFKAPPDASRTVEIAYFTFPSLQGRGWATAMASALTARAKESGEIDYVVAHTLPEPNASTRVLEKCGFSRDGQFVDPEDGLVWRWKAP